MIRIRPLILTAAALLFLAGTEAQAARFGPDGHTGTTYDVARQTFGVPADVAKVIALGSMAPDYLDFDTPAAHAQTPNPPIERNRVAVTEAVYRKSQENALGESRAWRRKYMNGAVEAMEKGQRERAAFLLGYAMHNSQDFSTHRGLPNIVHAKVDRDAVSPDLNRTRLEGTAVLTEGDLAEFRSRVGPENWRLFLGEPVRREGERTATVPEPLTTLAPGLADWDPKGNAIPPPPGSRPSFRIFHEALRKASESGDLTQNQQERADEELLPLFQAFFHGMYGRQDQMLSFLEGLHPGDPPARSILDLVIYGLWVHYTWNAEANAYDRLGGADQKMLGEVVWLDIIKRDYREMAAKRLTLRKGLAEAISRDIGTYTRMKDEAQADLRWLHIERARIERLRQQWKQAAKEEPVTRPHIDGRPRPEPKPTRVRPLRTTREEPDQEHWRGEGDQESRELQRHKFGGGSTFDRLKGISSGIGGFD